MLLELVSVNSRHSTSFPISSKLNRQTWCTTRYNNPVTSYPCHARKCPAWILSFWNLFSLILLDSLKGCSEMNISDMTTNGTNISDYGLRKVDKRPERHCLTTRSTHSIFCFRFGWVVFVPPLAPLVICSHIDSTPLNYKDGEKLL